MAPPGTVFLMYHELELPGRPLVQSEPGYVRYILRETTFRAQMDWLRQNGWRGLNISNALSSTPEKSVVITFDDGCETDLITAAPILREAGFHATFYVTAGLLDQPGYLSTAQLKDLSSTTFEIGCHSMTHAYLDDLQQPDLRREILDARKKLEDLIGEKVEHFSCPGGRYSANALAVVKESGYRSLATSHARANSLSTDPFQLGRVAIMRTFNLDFFQKICTGDALWKMRFSEFARGAARTALGNKVYDRFRSSLLREEG